MTRSNIEEELCISREVRNMDPHNTISLALERHLMQRNATIPTATEIHAAKTRA